MKQSLLTFLKILFIFGKTDIVMVKDFKKEENFIYSLEITKERDKVFYITIYQLDLSCRISFKPDNKKLIFAEDNSLSNKLKQNEYQLRKILHNKKKESFYKGFKLKFVIRNNKNVIDFNDTSKLIILDKTKSKTQSYPTDYYKSNKPILYTDGSHLPKIGKSAVAVILKKTSGLLSLYTEQHDEISSTLSELLAAIKAAEIGEKYKKYRIITDSRYVIKGLTEWIENWKLNDWHTAQGTQVKNIKYWQKFDQLTNNKFIEFEWVKAHSEQFENTLCDFYAKKAAAK